MKKRVDELLAILRKKTFNSAESFFHAVSEERQSALQSSSNIQSRDRVDCATDPDLFTRRPEPYKVLIYFLPRKESIVFNKTRLRIAV